MFQALTAGMKAAWGTVQNDPAGGPAHVCQHVYQTDGTPVLMTWMYLPKLSYFPDRLDRFSCRRSCLRSS